MSGYDPTDIAGIDASKAQRDKRSRDEAYLAREDMRWLMSSKRGRRIVWMLLERTGIFRSSFTGNSETFFREGQRNVGLILLAQIHEVCPESYLEMLNDQKVKDANDRNAIDKPSAASAA